MGKRTSPQLPAWAVQSSKPAVSLTKSFPTHLPGQGDSPWPRNSPLSLRSGHRSEEYMADLEKMVFAREWNLPHNSAMGMLIMSEVTRVLACIDQGDATAAEQLLPLVYTELRRLAADKMAQEKPGQTLQATALVHEAYLRLVGQKTDLHWNSRGHFFAAAAEAMRRILIERARHKNSQKAGGHYQRTELCEIEAPADPAFTDMLTLHEALARLEQKDRRKAELVKLRFFAGLTNEEAAHALGISSSTADNDWAYARAWLRLEIDGDPASAT